MPRSKESTKGDAILASRAHWLQTARARVRVDVGKHSGVSTQRAPKAEEQRPLASTASGTCGYGGEVRGARKQENICSIEGGKPAAWFPRVRTLHDSAKS